MIELDSPEWKAYGLTHDDLEGDWDITSGNSCVTKLIFKEGMCFKISGVIRQPDKKSGRCQIKIIGIETAKAN